VEMGRSAWIFNVLKVELTRAPDCGLRENRRHEDDS
jgi:hypothetical protein